MGKTLYASEIIKNVVKQYYLLNSLRQAADVVGVSKSQLHRWVSEKEAEETRTSIKVDPRTGTSNNHIGRQ